MKLTKIYATSGHYFTKIASYGTVFPDHLLFTFVELDKIRQFTQNVVKTWYLLFSMKLKKAAAFSIDCFTAIRASENTSPG